MIEEEDQLPVEEGADRDLDAVCEGWVAWCRKHALYWPPSTPALVRLSGTTRPLSADPASVPASSLMAFHIAYMCQPIALDRQVFDLYYVARVRPIKAAAAALGIGRAHFYRVLVEFRTRVDLAARALEKTADAGAGGAAGYSLQLFANHDQAPAVNSESVSPTRDNLTK